MFDARRGTAQALDVVTVVASGLRDRLDLALGEVARSEHLPSVTAAMLAVRERPVRAVLLGQESMTTDSAPSIGKLAVTCGGTLIAVVGGWTPTLSDTLLAFGRYGVRDAVDVSSRDGLARLRNLITRAEWELANRISTTLAPSLHDASVEMKFFMNYLVRTAPFVGSVRALAAGLNVHHGSLTSRFFRAGLPSPKKYLALMRLLFAAALLEQPIISAAQAARRLNYSSPQSFMRHVRAQLGVSVCEFRQQYTFQALAHHVVFHTLSRHEATIRWFRPLHTFIPEGDARQGVG